MSRKRKSSSRVTLVLIGLASVAAGCNRAPDMKRDVYASREDCLADWGNKPEDCTPATDRPRHGGGGFFFYGPMYAASAMNAWRSGSSWTGSGSRPGSHAVGSTSSSSGSVSRGGFGSSGHSSAS
jgi:uncharacterized protein YgiB involved in biofilm formation